MVVTLSNCQVWAPDNTEATTISKPADNTVKVISHSNRTAIRKPAAKLRHVQTQHVTLVNVLVVLVPEPRKLANSLAVNAESNVLCQTLVQTVTEHVSNVTIFIERAIHPFSVLRPLALKSNRPHFYKSFCCCTFAPITISNALSNVASLTPLPCNGTKHGFLSSFGAVPSFSFAPLHSVTPSST